MNKKGHQGNTQYDGKINLDMLFIININKIENFTN